MKSPLPIQPLTEIIRGTCPSKSNCYRIGDRLLYKTKALTTYENNFYIQCRQYRNVDIRGYFELHVRVFYPNQRADLDNAMKIILDCLQKAGAIKNDNKCIKIVAEKFLDKWDFDAYIAEFRSGKEHSRREALVASMS